MSIAARSHRPQRGKGICSLEFQSRSELEVTVALGPRDRAAADDVDAIFGQVEVWVIGQVEALGTELKIGPFGDKDALGYRGVEHERAGAVEDVAAAGAEAIGAERHNRERGAVEPAIDGRRVDIAFSDSVGAAGFAVGVVEVGGARRVGRTAVDSARRGDLPLLADFALGFSCAFLRYYNAQRRRKCLRWSWKYF